jgi:crotonobetainyl-CoA:carnitine CoA-transferase CaiB-like acyl-CoA transferase
VPIICSAIGPYRGVTRPIKFGRTPGPEAFAAPALGQDSDSVAREAGCSQEEAKRLRDLRAMR